MPSVYCASDYATFSKTRCLLLNDSQSFSRHEKTWPLAWLLMSFRVLAQHPTVNNTIKGTVVETSKLNFSLNAQLAHLWLTGTYNGQFYQNDGTQGNVNAFFKYAFASDLSLNLSYGYFTGNIFFCKEDPAILCLLQSTSLKIISISRLPCPSRSTIHLPNSTIVGAIPRPPILRNPRSTNITAAKSGLPSIKNLVT